MTDSFLSKLWIIIVCLDAFILFKFFDKECDQPFGIWLIVRMIHSVVFNIYHNMKEDIDNIVKGLLVIDIGLFIWLGSMFFNTTCKDTNPNMYNYISIHLFAYNVALFIILLIMVLSICSSLFSNQVENRNVDERRDFVRRLAEEARNRANGNSPVLDRSRLLDHFSFIPGSSLLQSKDCPICLEHYKEEDTLIKFPCRHEFHKECAETWLLTNLNCPLCRYSFTPENP